MPATEAVLMIRPHLAAIISAITAWVQRNVPFIWMSSIRCHSAGEMSRKVLIWPIPALLTKMVIGPSCLRASVTMASTSSFLDTSARSASAFLRRDDPLSSAATASAPRWLMSVTTTRAPSWANSSAVALPKPDPAPVTIAILPLSRISAPFRVGTAVGAQQLPGDKPSLFGRQIHHRVSDIFRLAQFAHRNGLHHMLDPALWALPQHRGIDHPWRHRIDRDAGAGQLAGHGDGEPSDASLGRTVVGQPHPTSECAHRGGTDEPAPVALEHAGQDRAETVICTVEVDAEHLVPLRLSDLRERGLLSDTGV